MPVPVLPPTVPCFVSCDAATTEIYTLSLHDALPIWRPPLPRIPAYAPVRRPVGCCQNSAPSSRNSLPKRSEEHTSELQSHSDLVCRLLLEKKNQLASAQKAEIDTSKTSTAKGKAVRD